jgi:hypothetical protein
MKPHEDLENWRLGDLETVDVVSDEGSTVLS